MSQLYQSNIPELTVSELATDIKKAIEDGFDRVRVRGELGRVNRPKSGHFYATLKDGDATIDVVMWRWQVSRLIGNPKIGMEVIVEGKVTTFPNRSSYQIQAESIRPVGEGELLAMLEELRNKLRNEGLFDSKYKKPLPKLPRTIGVVTSKQGAVIHDILHRVNERFPVRVVLWDTSVQGDLAPKQITDAIIGFNELPKEQRPDVLIVGRGGGSIEDLWAFNSEDVARAAFDSKIPLISAVGHESDNSILDSVADVRAPTPTAAAEFAVPVRQKLVEQVENFDRRLSRYLTYSISKYRERLNAAKLPHPNTLINDKRQKLENLNLSLTHALTKTTQNKRLRFSKSVARLRVETLQSDISRKNEVITRVSRRLEQETKRNLKTKETKFESLSKMLLSLSYKSTLQRGFAVVRSGQGDDGIGLKILDSKKEASQSERLQIEFHDGEIEAHTSREDNAS